MADLYIVVRGLNECENGRWYNLTRMAKRGSTRMSPEERAMTTSVTLGPTGVFEFSTYGDIAEVYRPVGGRNVSMRWHA